MPLLQPTADRPQIHLAAEVEEARPRPTVPTRSGLTRSDALAGVAADTRRSWPLVAFHLLVLSGSVVYAAEVSAQPVEVAAGAISPEALQAVAGDPWATVVVAALFVGGQIATAWREWSKVRGADIEKARARIEALEEEAVKAAKEIAKLEAKAELAQLREGDARAAASGTTPGPAPLPGE